MNNKKNKYFNLFNILWVIQFLSGCLICYSTTYNLITTCATGFHLNFTVIFLIFAKIALCIAFIFLPVLYLLKKPFLPCLLFGFQILLSVFFASFSISILVRLVGLFIESSLYWNISFFCTGLIIDTYRFWFLCKENKAFLKQRIKLFCLINISAVTVLALYILYKYYELSIMLWLNQ